MADETIDNAIDFYSKIKDADEVKIKFRKKDNSIRIMLCTLNFDKVPDNKKPKDVNMARILKLISKNGIINVFDIENGDWKSVPFKTTEWMDVDDTRFHIKH